MASTPLNRPWGEEPDARLRSEAARRRSLDVNEMTRKGWTNIAIPNELAAEIRTLHVPGRAKSVQAYVIFWTRAGSLVDRAIAASGDPGDLANRVVAALDAARPKA